MALMTFIFLFHIVAYPEPATFCTCSAPSLPRAYHRAKAVFLGRVLTIENATEVPPELEGSVFFKVRFRTERFWKGKTVQEITILTDQGWLSCSGPATKKYREGATYLVYAYDKTLNDFGCSRSVPFEYASKDMKRLDRDYGTPLSRVFQGMPELSIIIPAL